MGLKASKNKELRRLQKKFSAKELSLLKAIYVDLSQRCQGSGEKKCIDHRIFREVFKIPGPISDRIFHAFDNQNRGFIDYEEFIAGLAVLCRGNYDDKIDFLFKLFDLSGVGTISRQHLSVVLHTMLHAAYAIISHNSNDRRGHEDISDRISRKVDSFVDSAFKGNQDDYICKNEFVQWAKIELATVDLMGFLFKESSAVSHHRGRSQTRSPTPVREVLTLSDVIRSSSSSKAETSICSRIALLDCRSTATATSGISTSFIRGCPDRTNDYSRILQCVYNDDEHGFHYSCPKCYEQIDLSYCIECGNALPASDRRCVICDDCSHQEYDATLFCCYCCGAVLEESPNRQ